MFSVIHLVWAIRGHAQKQQRHHLFSRGHAAETDRLDELCTRHERPSDEKAFAELVPDMVAEVVRRQATLGLAVVNDGEYGKKGGFSYYIQTRLAGIEERPTGRDNVIAGTDCGLGGRTGQVEIAWAKLQALVEGARLATTRL